MSRKNPVPELDNTMYDGVRADTHPEAKSITQAAYDASTATLPAAEQEPDEEEKPAGARTIPELRTMQAILRLIEKRPAPERRRIKFWLADYLASEE